MNKEQRLVYENLSAKSTKLNVNYNKQTYKIESRKQRQTNSNSSETNRQTSTTTNQSIKENSVRMSREACMICMKRQEINWEKFFVNCIAYNGQKSFVRIKEL